MLHSQGTLVADHRPANAGSDIEVDKILAAIRRRIWTVLLLALVGLALGVAYLATAVPLYTSSTQLLIDTREARSAQESALVTDMVFDASVVESEVEVLKSQKIAEAVVDRLGLLDNPVFTSREGSLVAQGVALTRRLVDRLVDLVAAPAVEGADLLAVAERPEASKRAAGAKLRAHLGVERVQRTQVLDISYTSPDRALAAQIANAYAEAYITDKLDAKFEATRRAGEWLQQRIVEAEQQSRAADLAVQNFRRQNNMMSASGELLSDQQLTGVNAELITARSEAGQAAARYERIRSIIDNKQTDAAVSEALQSGIISDLRTRYLDASKRYQEIVARLGPAHAQGVKLRGEMAQYERLIFEELKRIAQVYKSNLEVAGSRVDALSREVDRLAGMTASATQSQSALRDLERQATIFRGLHESLLARYEETAQRSSFPITEARVITSAAAGMQTYPRSLVALALSTVLGAMLGGALGVVGELRDRVFRTGEQVREELGVEFIGMLNLLRPVRQKRSPGPLADGAEAPGAAVIANQDPVLRHTIDAPLSSFAETLRATKVACDLVLGTKKTKLVGIVSMLPREGKTTVSKNLASLVSSGETRTLLVDADLRNPGLSRGTVKGREGGLLDVLHGHCGWRDALVVEESTGLSILPTFPSRSISHTADLLTSPRMRALLAEAGEEFDYIFVDLPPLGAVVDARALAPLLDALVFVVEWGHTDRKLVRTAFDNDRRLREMCVGVVFNKVDPKKMRLYDSYHSSAYYGEDYASYRS
ncbi:Wzz/FepE/Etk N-terminal domain-containing protein [Aureimonas glaciei]|uniref:non-specific protein-tyrosine kinase n=1 Tax=Aureimonas glaciei TaxID=1776957 RepID=A0A916Y5U4_9HYPH|nr:Wzz/FepE/Etk N-terminal domain-containing protein [Aureimonas glaciei]GGD31920.1 chromosome partitioning protein ParA [Aureimonas glaciei]